MPLCLLAQREQQGKAYNRRNVVRPEWQAKPTGPELMASEVWLRTYDLSMTTLHFNVHSSNNTGPTLHLCVQESDVQCEASGAKCTGNLQQAQEHCNTCPAAVLRPGDLSVPSAGREQ